MWQSENCDVCANILYWRIYYMDKYIFDKNNGLWYELQGDYYIPCLILSEEETQPIGFWGQRHKQYLKEHRHIVYTTMLIDGTLNRYLADINRQAEQRPEGSDRASSKGYIVRWVEAPSNKLLITAFEASLESVTVTRRLSVDSKIAGIAMEHRNPKVSEGRHRGQGGRQYMHLSLW